MGPLRRVVCHSAWPSPYLLTRRLQLRSYGTALGPEPVASVTCTEQDGLNTVLEQAYRAEQPLLVRNDRAASSFQEAGGRGGALLPAVDRWFVPLGSTGLAEAAPSMETAQLAPHLGQKFSMVQLPYELVYHPLEPARIAMAASGGVDGGEADRSGLAGFLSWLASKGTDSDIAEGSVLAGDTHAVRPSLAALLAHHMSEATAQQPAPAKDSQARFLRFHAPLALLLAALEYNRGLAAAAGPTNTRATASPVKQLYIAQASLAELPTAMQEDLPVPPPLARRARPRTGATATTPRAAGSIRGDLYDSSLWLGLEPTYTPWHRDPNPNLFGQLCSRKTVRLMPPAGGERLFRAVQTELARARNNPAAVHARIRGEEMLQGPERAALHKAVWGRAEEEEEEEEAASPAGMREARLGPGDLLFIPKGWWHSVKSAYADGRLNGSVNWWFR